MNKVLDQNCNLSICKILGISHTLLKSLVNALKPIHIEIIEDPLPGLTKSDLPLHINTVHLHSQNPTGGCYLEDTHHIVLEATLNKKYKITTLLDTGADSNLMDIAHFPQNTELLEVWLTPNLPYNNLGLYRIALTLANVPVELILLKEERMTKSSRNYVSSPRNK
ncbi:hypothetical protein Clacol_004479 [Clathrus columnatus]|uniref:Peptidase A2 domain-containing protein n=1 Tax=Clathrus columnatus TaxID=1419009 RepID=A0AAV5AAP2_9AGAM|nr:hypothetical protein Clacol_004479 [Clathrus columnatus]